MRYIVNVDNYITAISFGCYIECQDDGCTEYAGSVPTGYASLDEWYADEAEKLYRWKIVNGQLTLDSSAVAPEKDYDHLADKNNPHGVTAAQVGAEPALLESDTYSGCKYRMVGDEREWINPPMASGEEYRTTGRFYGKPVYRLVLDIGYLSAGVNSFSHGITGIDECVNVEMINEGFGLFTAHCDTEFSQTGLYVNMPWAAGAVRFILSYTRN